MKIASSPLGPIIGILGFLSIAFQNPFITILGVIIFFIGLLFPFIEDMFRMVFKIRNADNQHIQSKANIETNRSETKNFGPGIREARSGMLVLTDGNVEIPPH